MYLSTTVESYEPLNEKVTSILYKYKKQYMSPTGPNKL